MDNKEVYREVEMDVVTFETEDIIVTSPPTPGPEETDII